MKFSDIFKMIGTKGLADLLPMLLTFLNEIIEGIAQEQFTKEDLIKEMHYFELVWAVLDVFAIELGDNEEAVPDLVVDEIKEAMINIAKDFDLATHRLPKWYDITE